jgi:hypothetical protein
MSDYEFLIQGAKVVDGSGNPWFIGDVALKGKQIAAVAPTGRISTNQAQEVIAADGLVVCPGFIDIQSHSITPLMVDGRSLGKITQGVTTEIMGEAWTPAPYGGKVTTPVLSWFGQPDPGLVRSDGQSWGFPQHRLLSWRMHLTPIRKRNGDGAALN